MQTKMKINRRLMREWHTDKNSPLTSGDVSASSHKKVWWKCDKANHEWSATIASRTAGRGCPYCANKRVGVDNCLATRKPDLVKEWHPTKNKLTPQDVVPGSTKKVWWKCEKQPNHQWLAAINQRTAGSGCPFCSGNRPSAEHGLSPNLLKEWCHEKNLPLTPIQVTSGSNRAVWWRCLRHPTHMWKMSPHSRKSGQGCPYCSGRKIGPDNNLAFLFPALAQEWDQIRNGSLQAKDVAAYSGKAVWWKCAKHPSHQWSAVIASRSRGNGCPYCSNKKPGIDNCLQVKNPLLAVEWHPTKNGDLTPADIVCGSAKKVWWRCKRQEQHEWSATVNSRNQGGGCPKCHSSTSDLELRIFSEISYLFKDVNHRAKVAGVECDVYVPEFQLAIEVDGLYWHKEHYEQDLNKNKRLRNAGVSIFRVRESGLKQTSEDDVVFIKKKIRFKILSDLIHKILGRLALTGNTAERLHKYLLDAEFANTHHYLRLLEMIPGPLPGKDLATLYPQIAREWHLFKNGQLMPDRVSSGSGRQVWWQCLKSPEHEWLETVTRRTSGSGCPFCSGRRASVGHNLAILNPKLSSEWHPALNGDLTPETVTPGSNKKVWWKCKIKANHEWQAAIVARNYGSGCPYCGNKAVNQDNCLAVINPILAKQWHPTKNGDVTPYSVTPGSDRRVWWKCGSGHEWQAAIYNRKKGTGCPYCRRPSKLC